MVLWQREDGEAFGRVLLQPRGEFRRGVAIICDQSGQGGFGLCQRTGGPDLAQLGADALADGEVRRVVDGVPGEMELAALPFRAAEDRPACGPQASVIVGDDVFDPAQPACLEALEKGPPVHLGLRQGDGDAQDPAAFVGADIDRRQDGSVAQ